MPVRLALACVLGVALFASIALIYGTGLHRVPPHLAHDEVLIALNARSVASRGVGIDGSRVPVLFGDSAFGTKGGEPLTTYWTAFVMRTMWADEFAIRRASVLVGLLNVVLMFLLGWRYFGSTVAGAGAAVLLAATPVHFFYSRIGVEVVYLLPFVSVWLLLMGDDAWITSGRSLWTMGAAGLALGLSEYSYKTALILAPAYLGLTLMLVAWYARRAGVPARRIRAMAAAAVGGFALAAMPYAVDALRHSERIALFARAYGVGDPALSLLQNLRDVLRYQSIGTRLGIYFDSLNPTHLFFFGAGGWTDSTRAAGLFLVGVAVPIAVGLYVSFCEARSFSRSLVAFGFLLAPLSNVVLGEVTLRRMVPIVVFGALLAVEGWRYISARWRFGHAVAGALAVVTLLHFTSYYYDYLVNYPRNSFSAWELNLGEALQRLAERHGQRGGTGQTLILVQNKYVDDYARWYVKGSDVVQRAEHRRPTRGSLLVTEETRLVLRQLLVGEDPYAVCPSWDVTTVIREPHGDASFVICER